MLKVETKVNSKTTVVAEGETPLDVFTTLATLQELFGEEKCGKCGCENLTYRVRTVGEGKKTYTYPELVCQNWECRAKLSYGQMENGGLFPVRYVREDGENVKVDGKNVVKGSWGWVKFNRDTGKEE